MISLCSMHAHFQMSMNEGCASHMVSYFTQILLGYLTAVLSSLENT